MNKNFDCEAWHVVTSVVLEACLSMEFQLLDMLQLFHHNSKSQGIDQFVELAGWGWGRGSSQITRCRILGGNHRQQIVFV